MRALLVGCGAMANGWIRAIKEDSQVADNVEIAGLVDVDRARAEALAGNHDLKTVSLHTSVEEALQAETVDAVFDITPPVARANVVRAALWAGKHVLSEKPMANSMSEAIELGKLAEESGRIFAVTQNRRYSTGIRRAAAFLRSGGIGTVTGLHADFFLGPHFGGFREEMDHVLLLDMAIHTFDGARFLAGSDAQRVFCVEVNPAGSWYAHGASAFATFEMDEGAVFSYRGSWCAEGARTAWDSSWRITGSEGTLIWDGESHVAAFADAGPAAFLRDTEELTVPELPDDKETRGHASVIASFVEAVASGTPPETDYTDNIKSIGMVFGAIESAEKGHPVDVMTMENAA